MNTIGIIGIIAVTGIAYWLYSFWWGRPFSVKGLHARTFLRFALKGPELLTMLGILEQFGIHLHNAFLSDASDGEDIKGYRFIKRDLAILKGYRRGRMEGQVGLSTDIMRAFLEDQCDGERFRHHNYPLNQFFGAQSDLPDFMMNLHPVSSAHEGMNYVRRLKRFDKKFTQVLEGLKIRENMGIIPPRFVIGRVLEEMKSFIAPAATEHPLYTVLETKLAALKRLSPAGRSRILARAALAINSSVYPAYGRFIEYYGSLKAKATDDDGAWKLPDGEAYYRYCLRSHTTTDMSPEDVHSIGLAEVERIENLMRATLVSLGIRDPAQPAKALKELSCTPEFLYPNTDEGRQNCIDDYRKALADMEARLDDAFITKAKARLEVQRIPAFKEATAPGAYYQPGGMDGKRPGVFYANLRNMAEVSKIGMKTLAYHEGIPGHHFQIAIAQERKDLPLFRRMLPFTAYAEGWAMYCEALARELGMYKGDDWGLLGSLDSELFRAVRLVVDTGIHHKRWTRQEAIDYMAAHSAQDMASIVSEVERYIVMPGQACSYKIGMITMQRLRDKAKAALGPRFDLKSFHEAVLANGSMPLSILEGQVDGYIKNTRAMEPVR